MNRRRYRRRKKNKAAAENVLPGAAVLGLIHAGGNLLAQRKENEEAAEHTNAHEDHDHTEFAAGCQLHHFSAAGKSHDAGEAAGNFLLRDPHFKAALTGFHEVDH